MDTHVDGGMGVAGRMDNGKTEGWKKEKGLMDGGMDEGMEGWRGWMDGRMDGRIDWIFIVLLFCLSSSIPASSSLQRLSSLPIVCSARTTAQHTSYNRRIHQWVHMAQRSKALSMQTYMQDGGGGSSDGRRRREFKAAEV